MDIDKLDFSKGDGLIPAIIQDSATDKVLMLGHMNLEALQHTLDEGLVTFFSRSRQCIWTKGETSGNYLHFISVAADCDNDTLLIKARPQGPVCHTGSDTCWGEENNNGDFLRVLEQVIQDRKANPNERSYTSSLFAKGINKVAQKVGEEAVELVIEAKDDNDDLFLNEAADLMYHLLVLLTAKNHTLGEVVEVLSKRHK